VILDEDEVAVILGENEVCTLNFQLKNSFAKTTYYDWSTKLGTSFRILKLQYVSDMCHVTGVTNFVIRHTGICSVSSERERENAEERNSYHNRQRCNRHRNYNGIKS
jgi:hypothetical protein